MLINILIGLAIFGYAGWALTRFIKRTATEGKCASCSIKSSCSTTCSVIKAEKH